MPRRLLVAFLAGAAMVPAFAPFEWFPLALAALAVLVHLWLAAPGPRAAAALGFAFGMGMFLVGVSWVYISLHRYGAMPAPLAAIASVGFCAILAAYAALAGALQAKFRVPPALRAALVIPALWTLGEWLRATLFTGFPWLSLGTAALDTPLAGLAPLGGVYAVSLAAASAAGLLWCVATGQARWAAAAAFAILGVTGAVLRQFEWTVPAGAPFAANLVQGNVPQDLKFDPARYARTLEVHARLAEASGARLIVLPETAVPRMLDSVDPAYLERLRAAAARNGGDLLLGAPTRLASGGYFNSVVSLGASPSQRYHKQHLVPFGEFVPPGFGWIVRVLQIPLADFSRGAPEQRPLAVAGQRIAVNICYEDAYGGRADPPVAGGDAAGERLQRRLVRRLARAGAAPADRARARAGDRAHAPHGDQHRHHGGDRARRRRAGAPAAVRRRAAGGRGARLCRRHALRALRRRAGARPVRGAPRLRRRRRPRAAQPVESAPAMLTFQQLILRLNEFWDRQGCVLLQPYDMEVGAGTFHTATFLRAIGPEPWNAAYVQPSRRPKDGRYGENPNRLQHYYQYQVVLKPSPADIQERYLASLAALGIDAMEHDIRFVEDDWESPTLGAWGLGWEVWLDGMEVTQFTYFQEVGSLACKPVLGEITYGLERLAMTLQGKENVYDLVWTAGARGSAAVLYGDVYHQNEVEQSRYNFELSNAEMLIRHFGDFEAEARRLIEAQCVLPAYEMVMKSSHAFNLLEARGAISVTERAAYIARVRALARAVAQAYYDSREKLGFPMGRS